MTTFVFPGQGSQKAGMGEGLFSAYSNLTAAADEILGYSIEDICMNNPEGKLSQTQYTQPALYTVDVLSYMKKIEESPEPNYVMGHSLGEYAALCAAGVFDFETGLKLVKKRGELMSQAKGGGMLAVIGLSAEQVKSTLESNNLTTIDVANFNSYTQTIVSGLKDDVLAAAPHFEAAGAMMCMPLPVSGAFHSRYMKPSSEEFANFLDAFEFNAPKMPVIANVNAQAYSAETIKSNLISQIDHSVQWVQSVKSLIDQGETQFIEVGPGAVLTGLINKIKKDK